jgi:phosphoenolpyruvate---glycerone phosphotransferase subunit DhaL
MNGKTVMACIEAAHATLKQNTDEIALLDQQIGDGDHIFNLLRGMEALLAARGEIEAADFAPSLDTAASKVLSTVGGSSGPLFYSLLSGMSKGTKGQAMDVPGFAVVFAAGVDAVGQRGKTGVGSKTMMDVLIPVANSFRELAARPRKRSSTSCRAWRKHRCLPHATCSRPKGGRRFSASVRVAISIRARGPASS